jgi:hypothetical protein
LIASALALSDTFPEEPLWEVIPFLYPADCDNVAPRKSKKEVQVFKECSI